MFWFNHSAHSDHSGGCTSSRHSGEVGVDFEPRRHQGTKFFLIVILNAAKNLKKG